MTLKTDLRSLKLADADLAPQTRLPQCGPIIGSSGTVCVKLNAEIIPGCNIFVPASVEKIIKRKAAIQKLGMLLWF